MHQSKGVASVRSRVMNLSELNSAISHGEWMQAMANAFCAHHGEDASKVKFEDVASLRCDAFSSFSLLFLCCFVFFANGSLLPSRSGLPSFLSSFLPSFLPFAHSVVPTRSLTATTKTWWTGIGAMARPLSGIVTGHTDLTGESSYACECIYLNESSQLLLKFVGLLAYFLFSFVSFI
jgi:hypothetical protein